MTDRVWTINLTLILIFNAGQSLANGVGTRPPLALWNSVSFLLLLWSTCLISARYRQVLKVKHPPFSILYSVESMFQSHLLQRNDARSQHFFFFREPLLHLVFSNLTGRKIINVIKLSSNCGIYFRYSSIVQMRLKNLMAFIQDIQHLCRSVNFHLHSFVSLSSSGFFAFFVLVIIVHDNLNIYIGAIMWQNSDLVLRRNRYDSLFQVLQVWRFQLNFVFAENRKYCQLSSLDYFHF